MQVAYTSQKKKEKPLTAASSAAVFHMQYAYVLRSGRRSDN